MSNEDIGLETRMKAHARAQAQAGKGYLGDGGIATFIIVQLVRERVACRERWFILECTSGFNHRLLARVLALFDYI